MWAHDPSKLTHKIDYQSRFDEPHFNFLNFIYLPIYYIFERGSFYIAQVCLELVILQSQPP
jgi:hypothetical protein